MAIDPFDLARLNGRHEPRKIDCLIPPRMHHLGTKWGDGVLLLLCPAIPA